MYKVPSSFFPILNDESETVSIDIDSSDLREPCMELFNVVIIHRKKNLDPDLDLNDLLRTCMTLSTGTGSLNCEGF